MAKESGFDFCALYDKDLFVGYIAVQTYKQMAYLFFLAIDSNLRSSGYGSNAIRTLSELYPGKQQVVDMEMIDKTAKNNAQRIKRRSFYLRNGYRPTGHFLSYLGVDYEILCMEEDFDFRIFKEMMSTLRIEGFVPRYFTKQNNHLDSGIMEKLKTKRLLLRKLHYQDADLLYRELGCNPEITRYTGWNPYFTLNAAKEKVAGDIANYGKIGCYSWMIQCGNRAVGTVGTYGYEADISAIEIGYSIFQFAWGNGFASEAVCEVVKFLFESKKINRVHAWCHADNAASARVLEKAGMKQEGLLKQAMRSADGSLADQKLFGIIQDEWQC